MYDTTISIFTPLYRGDFIEELYFSLRDQSFEEWVILLNNGYNKENLPEIILNDSRINVVVDSRCSGIADYNIGFLKNISCSYCRYAILCEVDEDDILLPGAVDKVREAFDKNPEASLVHSNSAEFNDDAHRSPRFYGNAGPDNYEDTAYGWKYRDVWHEGFLYKEAVAPPNDPYHSSLILYQPNHLRAFRRSAYEACGGYDGNMSILDDSDLLCRLYLQGDFAHIDECLYLYRVHGGNTWLARNSNIQDGMHAVQAKYIQQMAEVWAFRKRLPKLDLGGRFNSPGGYYSVDKKDANINCDLNEKWPFADSSVAVIRANDVIEHLNSLQHVMSEIHRVLIPGGYLFSQTPSSSGKGAFMDPTHKLFLNDYSFWYFTRRDQAQYVDNTTIRFKEIILDEFFPNDWAQSNNIPYTRAYLMALKGDLRPHGTVDI